VPSPSPQAAGAVGRAWRGEKLRGVSHMSMSPAAGSARAPGVGMVYARGEGRVKPPS
jgi:hypothetical protein